MFCLCTRIKFSRRILAEPIAENLGKHETQLPFDLNFKIKPSATIVGEFTNFPSSQIVTIHMYEVNLQNHKPDGRI